MLQLTASGSEPYAAAPKRIQIACAAGAYGELVSEYLLAALLAFYHNLHLHRNHQLQHVWASPQPVSTLRGKTILILGGGDIGCCFARRIRSQNARAIGVIRSRCICAHAFDRLCTLDELDELLPQADAVALCIPGTPENHHLFDLGRLRTMKPGSVLLNAGRGNLVDTEALCTVLREGQLGGAILDVVEPEPLPQEHPLWDFENVILTPHDAGNFRAMPEALSDAIAEIAYQNFIRFLHAQPLINAMVSSDSIGYAQADPSVLRGYSSSHHRQERTDIFCALLSSYAPVVSTNSTRIPAPALGRRTLTRIGPAPLTAAGSSMFRPRASNSALAFSTSSTQNAM